MFRVASLIFCTLSLFAPLNAAKNNGGEALLAFKKGLEYHNQKNYPVAAQFYRKALLLDGALVSAAINLAITYEKLNETNAARQMYNEAVRIAPKSFYALYNRAQFFQKQGELDKAQSDYASAIGLRPEDASLYINLAALEIKLFENTHKISFLNAAENNLKIAAKLKTESAAFYFNKARLLELKNSRALARSYYEEAMRRYTIGSLEYKICASQSIRLGKQLE
ncbi:MAG: hypothetical protein LDLANPLL_02490 [Turneriella sp.]|nr:hypothetical protein [Turneriella sp.]